MEDSVFTNRERTVTYWKEEMFYLTTHSTHFIYSYMASDIWLRTILIVRKETRCHHIGYSFRLTARVLLYAPSHRQDSTYHDLCYTSHGALAGTRNSSMGPPHEGSIRRPIAPWANNLSTELHLAPVTYCVLEVLPFGGESVMVWVGIRGQKTPLVIVKGTLTTQCYINAILRPTVRLSYRFSDSSHVVSYISITTPDLLQPYTTALEPTGWECCRGQTYPQ